MHTESCPRRRKLSTDSDANSTFNNTSVLEDDLAISSSTLGQTDKSFQDQAANSPCDYKASDKVVYVNEETMDCNYAETVGASIVPEKDEHSPVIFQSDSEPEDAAENGLISNEFLVALEHCAKSPEDDPIAKSDNYLLARIHKYLTGVPPPPKHTICQQDCNDFIAHMRQNRECFLVDPFSKEDERFTKSKVEKVGQSCTNGRSSDHRAKTSLRNLTTAFDACDRTSISTTITSGDNFENEKPKIPIRTSSFGLDEISLSDGQTSIASSSDIRVNTDNGKRVTFKVSGEEPTPFFSTISVEDVQNVGWPLAFKHKTHGIHYNRSKTIEEFEGLTLKLCERYVGAETQSSCNIWFTKQAPASGKKQRSLARRNSAQSPGKRLSHLARRRRTFSSANLLGMADKKQQLVLNIKKPILKKGKSPRSSAKKRGVRPSPSPRKSKLETSKRALFQSPPNDRAGPSNRVATQIPSNPQRIKRALFSATKTKDSTVASSTVKDLKKVISVEESRKRKSEDDLEGPRCKWAKSLSFDCSHSLESNSADSWMSERYSTGSFNIKNDGPPKQTRCELSETHRKKLLWAVAEALRGKGIDMRDPRFKQCASQLARTVRKYLPDLENKNVPRKSGSTSDRMLKLAKHHVLLIVEAKSTEKS